MSVLYEAMTGGGGRASGAHPLLLHCLQELFERVGSHRYERREPAFWLQAMLLERRAELWTERGIKLRLVLHARAHTDSQRESQRERERESQRERERERERERATGEGRGGGASERARAGERPERQPRQLGPVPSPRV